MSKELQNRIDRLERDRAVMVKSLRIVAAEGSKDISMQRHEGEYVIIGRMMGAAQYALAFANEAVS